MLELLQVLGWSIGVVAGVALFLFVLWLGLRVVREDESGLLIKKFGPSLASGRIIALDGEAGYQAKMLPPGWHFPVWRFRYRVEKVPLITIMPGEIALVVAADGAATPRTPRTPRQRRMARAFFMDCTLTG